jgi:hypothetical protein
VPRLRAISEDLALLLEHLHLAAEAAEFLPLVGGQLAGLAPARVRVGLAQPVPQRLG